MECSALENDKRLCFRCVSTSNREKLYPYTVAHTHSLLFLTWLQSNPIGPVSINYSNVLVTQPGGQNSFPPISKIFKYVWIVMIFFFLLFVHGLRRADTPPSHQNTSKCCIFAGKKNTCTIQRTLLCCTLNWILLINN